MTKFLPSICSINGSSFIVVTRNVLQSGKIKNKGGTNYSAATVVYYLYDKAFSNGQLGYGCALAVILAIIIFIITALNFAGQDRWVKTMD